MEYDAPTEKDQLNSTRMLEFATEAENVMDACVLVNTLQYHDTVDFVQDSETEDPQLGSGVSRGTKP